MALVAGESPMMVRFSVGQALEDLRHHFQQRVAIDGFFQILVNALARRFHGRLNGGVAGDHDHGDGGVIRHNLTEQLEAGHASQVEVGDDQVEAALREQFERGLAAGGGLRVVALSLQNVAIDFALPFFVVNYQDLAFGHWKPRIRG